MTEGLSELRTKDPKMLVFMVYTCEEYVQKKTSGLCKKEAHSDYMTSDPPMHSPSPHFFFLSPKRQSHNTDMREIPAAQKVRECFKPARAHHHPWEAACTGGQISGGEGVSRWRERRGQSLVFGG